MFDGLHPLRSYYGVPVDVLSDDVLCSLIEPLMNACLRENVLWELTAEPVERPAILKRANDLGVRFTATADAHMPGPEGWAPVCGHSKAEEYISSMKLTKGTLRPGRS